MSTQTIRQSVGIDVAMNDFKVCYGRINTKMEKEVIAEGTFENSDTGIAHFVSWLLSQMIDKEELYLLMEATGVYHERLAHYLHKQGLNVCIMPSGRVKKYAQSLKQRSKTDLLDAKMLCYLALERELELWTPPKLELLELRQLTRERGQLIREQSALKCKLHALEHGVSVNNKTTKRLKQRLALLAKQISEIEKEMKQLVASDTELSRKTKQLSTIPGVNFLTATVVTAETLGFQGINNAKQLTSYTGYDVVHRESGLYAGKTTISKRGNKNIRAMLHMPSMTAVRCNPTLKPFYFQLKARKAKPIIALIAVQRKMLCLMYTLWKNDVDYDPKYQFRSAGAEAPT